MRSSIVIFILSLCALSQAQINDSGYTSLDNITEFTISKDQLKQFKISPDANRYRIVGTSYGYCGATVDYSFATVSPNLYFNFYCSDFAEIGSSHNLVLYRLPTARYSPPTYKNIKFTIV
jgi:hypothetical protein